VPDPVGDGKQALGIMLTCSKLALPKIAMVFDEDIDIWDDNAVKCAMAFRYMPHLDTIIIPGAFRPEHRFRARRPARGRGGDDRGRTDGGHGSLDRRGPSDLEGDPPELERAAVSDHLSRLQRPAAPAGLLRRRTMVSIHVLGQ
jgi:3-octaprenyl-4-hydroxybenzoate carboxy-lyase